MTRTLRCNGEWDGFLGRGDGRQDRTLGLTVGYPLRVEAKAGEANQEESKADDGDEESEKARVASPADEVSHSVVVGTAPGGGRHGTW